jgi:aminodeoxyfutalosine deaminase
MTAFAGLPKVELHCHLLGVINPALLARIRDSGIPPLVDPEVLSGVYPVKDLDSFRKWIETLRPYHAASPEAMRPILTSHVANLRRQGVVYSEIMISPAMFPSDTTRLLAAFHRWREWTTEMEEGSIQIEFIMVVPRTLAPELLQRDTANFIRLHREGLIAGVALVGPECGESIQRFSTSFERWRDAGLGIEVHAGEHGGTDAVWDAIRFAHPDRLGHALSAFMDRGLLEHIRSNNIHLEFCPTSNVRTGAIRSIGEHPIGEARKWGLSFSVNTDDPGAFECSMETEFQRAAETFRFTRDDFTAIFRNSLAARFASSLRYAQPLPDA